MGGRRIFLLGLLVAVVFALGGCAAPRPSVGLAMPAPHEARAANLLAGYLLGRGWTVRLAEDTLVEASRGGERLWLVPLLDTQGMDRVVVSRGWPRAEGADRDGVAAFALELNEALNVGQFRADDRGLVFQASLPFIGTLDPRLLDAFLDYSADVRLAVLRVQAGRRLLAPLEGEEASR